MRAADHGQPPRRASVGVRWKLMACAKFLTLRILRFLWISARALRRGSVRFPALPFGGEAARTARAISMQIVRIRGKLVSAEGEMRRYGARRRFRAIFTIRGNLDNGAIIQRNQPHFLRVSCHWRARPASASSANATRRSSPKKARRTFRDQGGVTWGINSHSFRHMRRMQIMRGNLNNSADIEEEGYGE